MGLQMTINSTGTIWIVVAIAVILIIVVLLRRRSNLGSPPMIDRDQIMEQTRRVAEDAARGAAQQAQDAAVRAYQQQQEKLQEEQSARRREGAARAKETKAKRIEALDPWRETFILFVKRLAEPFFSEWDLDRDLLDEWSRERASVYIARKPYVLEIIQSVHADARNAAESYAKRAGKSPREIARERAKGTRGFLRNDHCPYCDVILDEKAHLDHIRPVQRGGPSEAWNMAFVCVPCNRAKRDMSLIEFLESDYARRNGMRMSDVVKRLKALDKEVDVLL
jgi:hypothetical protein